MSVRETDLPEILAGEDKTYELDINEGGSDKDVSAWTDWEMLISQKGGRDVVLSGSDIDTAQAASGIVIIQLGKEDTEKLKEGKVEYKVTATNENDKSKGLAYGEIPVEVVE